MTYQEILESVKKHYFDLNNTSITSNLSERQNRKVDTSKKQSTMIPCTLSCTYDGFGNILYRNEQGQLHNPNEPAVMGDTCRYFLNDVEYSLVDWENEVQKVQRKKEVKEKIEEKNKELLLLIQELEKLS